MSRRTGIGVLCAVLLVCAPSAQAATPAEAAAKPRLAKFTLERLGATPASIRAGRSFRVRGRVANAKRRRAQTARLTFSLRTARTATARRERRLGGKNVKRTRGGRSRSFSVRLRVPASTRARRYVFFACVRRGSGTLRGSCKSRRMRVTARPAAGTPGAAGARLGTQRRSRRPRTTAPGAACAPPSRARTTTS